MEKACKAMLLSGGGPHCGEIGQGTNGTVSPGGDSNRRLLICKLQQQQSAQNGNKEE